MRNYCLSFKGTSNSQIIRMTTHPQHFVLFAIANTLFFAIIFWNYSVGEQNVNRILSLIFLIFGLAWSVDLFHDSIRYRLIFFVNSLYLLIGPLAYYFIKIKIIANYKLDKTAFKHFIPFILAYAIGIYCFFTFPNFADLVPTIIPTIWIFYQIQAIVYLFLIPKQVKIYNQQVLNFLSNQSTYNLTWLRKAIWGLGFMWIVWVLPNFTRNSTFLYYFFPILTIGLYIFFYYALQQNNPFEILTGNTEEEIGAILNFDKETEVPSDPLIEDFKLSLLNFMEAQKPYLDPELNLPKLASLLNVSTHFLSRVINKGMNENFFLFINRYRVEESKKQLSDPNKQHYNILQIAFDSGFNSKSTFNSVFKKTTGLSPSEFQKKVTINNANP